MNQRGLLVLWPVVLGGLLGPAYAPAGGFVLATERAGTTIAKINLDSNQVIGHAMLGSVPSAVAVDALRRWVYVSVNLGDRIAVVQADTLAAANVAIPGLGRQPIGVALTSDGGCLLAATRGTDGVVSADDRLDVVQLNSAAWPPTGVILASVPTGLHPVGVVVDHTDRYALVTVRNQPAILCVDLQTYLVAWQAPSLPADAEPEGCDLHPTANVAYATLHGPASTIEVFDFDTLTLVRHVPIVHTPPARPSGGRFTPDGGWFYVAGQTINKVLRFNTADPRRPVQDTAVQLPVGPQPHALAFFPDGRAYVANTNNGQPLGSLSVIYDYFGAPTVSGPILNTLAGPLDLADFSWLVLGDLNCDGAADASDIGPFVSALLDPPAYSAAYPLCHPGNADCNGDLAVNGQDVPPFVSLLIERNGDG